jgi:hypothetical protein
MFIVQYLEQRVHSVLHHLRIFKTCFFFTAHDILLLSYLIRLLQLPIWINGLQERPHHRVPAHPYSARGACVICRLELLPRWRHCYLPRHYREGKIFGIQNKLLAGRRCRRRTRKSCKLHVQTQLKLRSLRNQSGRNTRTCPDFHDTACRFQKFATVTRER